MKSLERAISKRLRRWLGLPRCLSGAALYGNSNALRLPFISLVEEFKTTKTRELLQYAESVDPKVVVAAGIQIRSGRKWSVDRELQVAEERLRHKAILGSIAKGRAGLGVFPFTHTNSAKGKERRQLIQKELRAGVEVRYCKMVGLSQQGAWTRWENVKKKRIPWSDCWRPDFSEIQFLFKSVYDVLPSPTNLHIWGKRERPLIANYVLGKDPYNISSVVAQKLWVMVSTVGVTIKHSR